jgi:hypothetical protein
MHPEALKYKKQCGLKLFDTWHTGQPQRYWVAVGIGLLSKT